MAEDDKDCSCCSKRPAETPIEFSDFVGANNVVSQDSQAGKTARSRKEEGSEAEFTIENSGNQVEATCDSCCGAEDNVSAVTPAGPQNNIRSESPSEAACVKECCGQYAEDCSKVAYRDCADSCCGNEASDESDGQDHACADSCCGAAEEDGVSHKEQGHSHSQNESSCAESCCESVKGGTESTKTEDYCAGCDDGVKVTYIVGDCIPNAQGGCQRSSGVCCTGITDSNIRRRHTGHFGHALQQVSRRAHKHKAHKHKTGKRIVHRSGQDCGAAESAFGLFFEAACCCLIDWANGNKRPSQTVSGSNSKPHVKLDAMAASQGQAEQGVGNILRTTMSIQGMDCPGCAPKVTRAMLSLPSVRDVKVNYTHNLVSLAFSEGVLDSEQAARRAGQITGFTFVVQTSKENDKEDGETAKTSVLHIRLGITGYNVLWDQLDLPASVHVQSVEKPGKKTPTVIRVEYNASITPARTVFAAFSSWQGTLVPSPKGTNMDRVNSEVKSVLLRTVLSAILCIPILVFTWAPIPENPIAYGSASFALATIIQGYVGAPLYSGALRSLFYQHYLDMDFLVVLSSSIAYLFSTVAFFLYVAGIEFAEMFFETSSLLLTLIMVGRFISAFARRRAVSVLEGMASLQPDSVELLEESGATRTIPAQLVHVGDILHVPPESLVPTDGEVVYGTSQVDESSLTGESMPVEKEPGSSLTAGTLNGPGMLHMKVKRTPEDNTVTDMRRLMHQVQEDALPVQDLADRVASWLAPIVLAIATCTFCIWIAVGIRVQGKSSTQAGIAAMRYAVAVMAVSCPCALVLVVPMVVVIATAVAGKGGVFFKTVQAVQYAKDVTAVVFDKTGTLTTGRMSVVDSNFRDEHVAAILGLVSESRHPVSRAIFGFLSPLHPTMAPASISNLTSIPGKGLEGLFSGVRFKAGSPTWLDLENHPTIAPMLNKGLTILAVVIANGPQAQFIGAFGLKDTLRDDVKPVVHSLVERAIKVYIVSGDSPSAVSSIASELGVPRSQVKASCLPQDKLAHVRAIQQRGEKLMFVGDGTNDALALAQADVGVSLTSNDEHSKSGSVVAASAADVLVFSPSALLRVLHLSRGAATRIYINFGWSFLYNLLAILGASGALAAVNVVIAPEYAGLGEMVSVVPVIVIAWSMWLLKQ